MAPSPALPPPPLNFSESGLITLVHSTSQPIPESDTHAAAYQLRTPRCPTRTACPRPSLTSHVGAQTHRHSRLRPPCDSPVRASGHLGRTTQLMRRANTCPPTPIRFPLAPPHPPSNPRFLPLSLLISPYAATLARLHHLPRSLPTSLHTCSPSSALGTSRILTAQHIRYDTL
ncbi:hypothetical protein B0H14DRAFT_1578329 [Mycena olivaceomarginata]|nr:hypothetical protein B0H14DRAFT_1578329 [Mycena olivaceomarginata]